MKKIVLLSLCSIILAGCSAPQPKLVHKVDPYTQKTGVAFGPLVAKPCPGASYDGMAAEITILRDGDLQVLNIDIEAQEWAFLNPRLPLNMLVDGNPVELTAIERATRNTKRYQTYSAVTESLFYPVSQSFVSSLADAQNVRFRVLGSKRSLERCLDATALKQLEQVVPLLNPAR